MPAGLDEVRPPQAIDGAHHLVEWALALDMVRHAGTTCRARMAAAQELVAHVRRWAQRRLREVEDAQRVVAEAQARAASAEARAEDAEARARHAQARLDAYEAQRVAADDRAEEASRPRLRRAHEVAYRGSKAAAGPIERRARRAFAAAK
jgi:hypothetical protein